MIVDDRLIGSIESLLFMIGDEGLTSKQLAILTETNEVVINMAIEQMIEQFEQQKDRGITIKMYGEAFRLVTKAEFAEDVKKLLENPSQKALSQAALEVLAIIAYKQPVTRVEIDDIRGVKSDGALQTLVAKGFIMEKGRLEGTGRPILYGTTDLFMDRFGITSLQDLPPLIVEEQSVSEETDLFMTKFQEVFTNEEDGGGTTA